MKNVLAIFFLSLTLAACVSTPNAPATAPVSSGQPAASTPATPAKPESQLSLLNKQLAEGCNAGKTDLCNANQQVTALLNNTQASSSSAPSFDCGKAISDVERSVCASKPLASLDAILGKLYKAAGSLDKTEQKVWLIGRNNCQNDECIAIKYAERILMLGK